MRWMIPHLLSRPEKKKIFFTLEDGNTSFGAISNKAAQAYKGYISLCKEAGIYVFGFGIECDLSHFFGDDWILVNTQTMGEAILTKLTEVLSRPLLRR